MKTVCMQISGVGVAYLQWQCTLYIRNGQKINNTVMAVLFNFYEKFRNFKSKGTFVFEYLYRNDYFKTCNSVHNRDLG